MYFMQKTANGIELIPNETYFLEKRVIFLDGEINDETVSDICLKLSYLQGRDEKSPVLLVISSPGGSIQSGLAIYSFLKALPFPVDVYVPNEAASMAAVLFICATGTRYLGEYGKLFLHEPMIAGLRDRSLSGMKETCESLSKYKQKLTDLLLQFTELPKKEVIRMLETDGYYELQDAISKKLADKQGDITLLQKYERRSL